MPEEISRNQWKVARNPSPKVQVKHLQCLVTHQLNRSRKNQCNAAMKFLDKENQTLQKMTKRITLILILNSPILLTLRVANLSVSERAEILPDSPKALFQTVNNRFEQAVIEAFYKDVRKYVFAPESKPLLTNPAEVQETFECFKLGKGFDPKNI
jgi:hypothetical protein